jgi:mannose-6-phosphate isomerase-like protein (cupin superfamily)
MADSTVLLKRRSQMPHEPLEHCHGGKGALDWTEVLGPDDLKGRKVQFIHDDILAPGVSVGLHAHTDDEEYYYILSGSGIMMLNDERIDVAAGDITAVFPGGKHSLENTGTEDMRILVISVSVA